MYTSKSRYKRGSPDDGSPHLAPLKQMKTCATSPAAESRDPNVEGIRHELWREMRLLDRRISERRAELHKLDTEVESRSPLDVPSAARRDIYGDDHRVSQTTRCMLKLVQDVTTQYRDKEQAVKLECAESEFQTSSTEVWAFNVSAREPSSTQLVYFSRICVQTMQKGWHSISVTDRQKVSYSKITQPTVVKQLNTLLDPMIQKPNPIVGSFRLGSRCRYTIGRDNYEARVTVVFGHRVNIGHKVLFGQAKARPQADFFLMDEHYIDELLKMCDANECDHVQLHSEPIKRLAQQWSSYSMKYEYSDESQMWIKPTALKLWLKTAKARGYYEARLVCHGMKTGDYDFAAVDPCGLRTDTSESGALGHGLYFAAYDAIGDVYNRRSAVHGAGTFVLALVLQDPNGKSGGCESFNLSKKIKASVRDSSFRSVDEHDAFNLRDPTMALCIGMAVGKP